jgi:uncharacterized protein
VLLILLVLLVLGLAFAPQWWVRRVIRTHAVDRPDIPGTGGEFALHLLQRLQLKDVGVEPTDGGDHYDPAAHKVRLGPLVFAGRSLSAMVIAAHEVGHAMQDAAAYAPLRTRTRLAGVAQRVERAGVVVMLLSPVILLLVRSPLVAGLEIGVGILILMSSVVMHLVTLPVEFDASFKRALPLLQAGGYLQADDLPAARSILRAAALTYVAAAAMTLLNVSRWIRILRG